MKRLDRETFLFKFEVPAGAGRRLAAFVKRLGRYWGIKAVHLESADLEVLRLQGIVDGLADRVAQQSELLTRRAEGRGEATETAGTITEDA